MIALCYLFIALCFFVGVTHQKRSCAGIAFCYVAFGLMGALDPFGLSQVLGSAALSIMSYIDPMIAYNIPLNDSDYVYDIFTMAQFAAVNVYLTLGAFFIVYLFDANRYYKHILWLIVGGVLANSISLILWTADLNYGLLNVAYNLVALYVIYDRESRGSLISDTISLAVSICRGSRMGSYKWKA